ncbi:MAG: hypothetical protein QF364_06380, partial [Candidatus Poseidoniaceae archaeon]|nr:hypothetical protein [Candidatus Poseidoniaceae archaeon]
TVPVSLDIVAETKVTDDAGWEEMSAPVDDEPVQPVDASPPTPTQSTNNEFDHSDERAQLEAELARLDASWNHRNEPTTEKSTDPALAALEARLSGLDL